MDIYSFGPIAAVLDGAYGLVTLLADLLAPIAGAASAAVAVVALTVLVRAALIPVGVSQVRAERTRARLAPQLAALNSRYAADPARLKRETVELYAREKASPFAGCLPLLLQAPVLSIVYALFLRDSIAGHTNALLAHRLFGVPLGTSFVHLLSTAPAWPAALVFLALLGLLTCVVAVSRRVLSTRLLGAQPLASSAEDPLSTGAPGAGAGIAEHSGAMSGVASPGTTAVAGGISRALTFIPFVTVLFAAFVPLAAVLYVLTTTSWTVCERTLLRRLFDDRPAGR